jgi:hypothetical protein
MYAAPNVATSSLLLDFVGHDAALYACRHWHYSRNLSLARNVYLGVWEAGKFAGAVVFGIGSGNATNGRGFGLRRAGEVAELTRVALRPGHAAPVSRVVAIALRLLRRQSPGLRLVISFADTGQGHHGGIYQAGGWIYTGDTAPDWEYWNGREWKHHRTMNSVGSVAGLPRRRWPPKHRYLMPLDPEMRARIAPLAKPYPRPKQAMADTPIGTAAGWHRPGRSALLG